MARRVGAPGSVAHARRIRRARRSPGEVFETLCDVLEAVRREKSTAKVSQRAEVELLGPSAVPPNGSTTVRAGQADLQAAGGVREFEFVEARESRSPSRSPRPRTP